jgi:hypothetical protein
MTHMTIGNGSQIMRRRDREFDPGLGVDVKRLLGMFWGLIRPIALWQRS